MATKSPLIVILGPTASGKTGLAIKLAKRFGGEIISADSRAVYRGMDIGTAKPTAAEMDGIKHYLIDIVNPNQAFSAADFQILAKQKIDDIRKNGKIPFLVGGSGMYIDSLIFEYQFGPKPNQKLRQRLDKMSLDELRQQIIDGHIEMPDNSANRRYLIRAIEQNGVNKTRNRSIKNNVIVVGIDTKMAEIEKRIKERILDMLHNGFIDEVAKLVKTYGDQEPFHNNSYGVAQKFLHNEIDQAEMIEQMVVVDRQLVKKQLTWFKRNPFIKWLSLDAAEKYISDLLSE
jgi:tRNA dimethylallyltransferase